MRASSSGWSPPALARTREALSNGWDKNDPKDAQVILHMLRIGACQRYHDPLASGINDIQELSKTQEMIARAKTELWHRLLTHYLPLYFPEAERFRGNARSDWFLAFLEAFPTPASITPLDKEAFIAAAWHIVGRKVSKRRLLADIYETAAESIALPVDVGDLVIRWQPGQNSALDAGRVAEGRDVGTVTVRRKLVGGGFEDVVYDVPFAFAFRAFNPDARIHHGE